VADTGNHRIVKLSPSGHVLAIWGGSYVEGPFSVAVDQSGNVYGAFAVDAGPNCDPVSGKCGPDFEAYVVDRFSPSGTPTGRLRQYAATTESGSSLSIAVGGRGMLYVTGPGCGSAGLPSDRVERRAPNGSTQTWGNVGARLGQFDESMSLAVGSGGNVYVVETWNDRVQKFSPRGIPLARWGTAGGSGGWFASPEGLTIGPTGNLYVNDGRDVRVQELSSTGSWIRTWQKPLAAPPFGESFYMRWRAYPEFVPFGRRRRWDEKRVRRRWQQ